jgi:hypothetical protein
MDTEKVAQHSVTEADSAGDYSSQTARKSHLRGNEVLGRVTGNAVNGLSETSNNASGSIRGIESGTSNQQSKGYEKYGCVKIYFYVGSFFD